MLRLLKLLKLIYMKTIGVETMIHIVSTQNRLKTLKSHSGY